jgi:CYTH domain-containing protein
MIERERRFLVAGLPVDDADLPVPQHIVQGYLTTGRVTVRVRRIDGDHILTVKTGSGRNRVEIERVLAAEEYDALWAEATELRIEKRRHRMQLDCGHVAELDLFDGALAGRRIVEVEFPDDETADAFVAPGWFGREVTEDRRYTNASLAERGWPED